MVKEETKTESHGLFRGITTKQLIVMALLMAISIVLTRLLGLQLLGLKLNLSFLPLALVGILYGPWWCAAVCALGDVLGVMVMTNDVYFPGFTVTMFLTGLTYGFVLHGKPLTWKRCLVAACIASLFINLGLDSGNLWILYGDAIVAWMPARILKAVVMVPIQTVLISVTYNKCIARMKYFQ